MLKSIIKTIHEEEIPENNTVIGILLNQIIDKKSEIYSYIFLYKKDQQIYIIFNTIVDMFDYYYYGNEKCKRAYLKESEFDKLYDIPFEGKLNDILQWS